MPMNIVIASTAMVTSVDAAFLLSGGRNAGTPFETASTPVIAVQPLENAVRSANVVSSARVLAGGAAARRRDGASVAGEIPPARRRRASRGC